MFKSFIVPMSRFVEVIARRLLFFGLLWGAVSMLSLPVWAQAPAPIDEQRQAAAAFYQQGRMAAEADQPDYAAAVAAHEKALALDPTRAQNVIGLADALWGAGRIDEVVSLLTEWREKFAPGPEKQLIILGLARIEAALGKRKALETQWREAAEHYLAAAQYYVKLEQPAEQAEACMWAGTCFAAAGDIAKAIPQHELALALYRQLGQVTDEIDAWISLGGEFRLLNRRDNARTSYNAALKLIQEHQKPKLLWRVYKGLGDLALDADDLPAALTAYTSARDAADATGDHEILRMALKDMAIVFQRLGQFEQAAQYLLQALNLIEDGKDDLGRAIILLQMANLEAWQDHLDKSIEYNEAALSLFRGNHDESNVAITLSNLASAYLVTGQYDKLKDTLAEAFDLAKRLNDIKLQAKLLDTLSLMYWLTGKDAEALENLHVILLTYHETGDRFLETNAYVGLMNLARHQKQYRRAAFWGKEAINRFQDMRTSLRHFDKASQQSFLKPKAIHYRDLAGILIEQDRLAEAVQVINLLKQEEYLNAFASTTNAARDLTKLDERATLTTREAHWHDLLEEAGNRLDQTGARWRKLNDKPKRTPAEEEELQAAERENQEAQSRFLTLLKEIEQDFAGPLDATDHIERVADAQDLQDALRQLGHHSVALYTLAGEKQLDLLLVTPDSLIARRVDISEEELNRKIRLFRQVLQNPVLDPRPMGQELYDVLLKPVLGDLEASGAENLMWSLDGALRYIPVAALYDGKQGQYLAEQYRNSLFTPASLIRLERAPHPSWQGLGLGVSKPHPGFSALQSVPRELKGIFRVSDAAQPASPVGVLQGRILLDEQFTRAHLLEALKEGFPLVHIASHFTFRPGDANDTFLLLGDGDHLTLAEIQALPDSLLAGVDLLTLSACDTADGGADANGREVENVAVLAQRKGADAVLASLWPVSDEGTATLMQNFYRQRQGHPEQGKAEALREAQLQLMQGSYATLSEAERGVRVVQSETQPKDKAPLFTADPKAPFAHPYFWAPFILMGNWR